ncbi:MAG TPA: DUF6766 family protein [Caulobacteraceae bacterium]
MAKAATKSSGTGKPAARARPAPKVSAPPPKRSWLHENGLSVALLSLFLFSVVGQALTGLANENQELAEHGEPAITLIPYLLSGDFLSALFENWESEFLQMWAYVMLTAYLFQKGSPESKSLYETNPEDRDPALDRRKSSAPWAVRQGGIVTVLYSHSLGFALLGLFVLSFALHWHNSLRAHVEEALQHNQPPPEASAFLFDPQFWFESFQNWQSEFLSTAVLVVLAIFLRERGSPESKAVGQAHRKTGTV